MFANFLRNYVLIWQILFSFQHGFKQWRNRLQSCTPFASNYSWKRIKTNGTSNITWKRDFREKFFLHYCSWLFFTICFWIASIQVKIYYVKEWSTWSFWIGLYSWMDERVMLNFLEQFVIKLSRQNNKHVFNNFP